MLVYAATPREVQSLPSARGPLSAAILQFLNGSSTAAGVAAVPAEVSAADPYGDDLQLALYLAYELHYRSVAGVDDELEWDPQLLALRRLMERHFLAALRGDVPVGDDVAEALEPLLTEPSAGTGPSWHLAERGERWQLREYIAHRSIYHLKEADPQSWVIPRLQGQAKAALVTVQHDEYGAGRGERMHAQLFADTLLELDLDSGYGAYVELVPAQTLAPVNLMSLCGLHRSLRGSALGHFATVEVTSSPGSARLSAAFRRLGGGVAGQRFYDEHIEADAVHEQLIRGQLLGDLLAREPELAADVVFGIRASSLLEERFGKRVMDAWVRGGTSLLQALPA